MFSITHLCILVRWSLLGAFAGGAAETVRPPLSWFRDVPTSTPARAESVARFLRNQRLPKRFRACLLGMLVGYFRGYVLNC
jgi:hypothetical protein